MSLGRANTLIDVVPVVPIHNLFAVMSDVDSTLSNTTDKLVPVTSDGTPITWADDNDAHLEGLLYEGWWMEPSSTIIELKLLPLHPPRPRRVQEI